jgi:SP family general alpha glucoside:H+ symporter-like MFS transporter
MLLPHMDRCALYLGDFASLATCLLIIGALGVASSPTPSNAIFWAIGSMLLVYTFFYDVTVGPVAHSLVSPIPSVELRGKSIVL